MVSLLCVRQETETNTKWIVNSRIHYPSAAARNKLSQAAAREKLTLTWAVPVDGNLGGLGRLWSHFPTSETISLAGIVQAPFHLKDDRSSIVTGLYNEEILQNGLSELVKETLPLIHMNASDPARILDVLPSPPDGHDSWAIRTFYLPLLQKLAY